MLAAKIKLGNEYAIRYEGRIVGFRADAIVTVRNLRNTENHVEGIVVGVPGTGMKTIKVAMADILDDVESYKEAQVLKAKQKAAEEAATAAKVAKKTLAARLLAEAIGTPVITESGYGSDNRAKLESPKGCVMASYSNIEITDKALDALIAYLQGQGVTVEEDAAA